LERAKQVPESFTPPYDSSPAALQPLMETFWTAEGWRPAPVFPPWPVWAAAAARIFLPQLA
jgi:hypothetical protein